MQKQRERMWSSSHNALGAWYWFSDVTDEWAAGVCDDSQVYGVPHRTHYDVFCTSRDQIFQLATVVYLDLAAAKEAALDFALMISKGKYVVQR